jgi:hypothetical protein
MDLKEIELVGVDWVSLAQDRDWWRSLVNTVMNHLASSVYCYVRGQNVLLKGIVNITVKNRNSTN